MRPETAAPCGACHAVLRSVVMAVLGLLLVLAQSARGVHAATREDLDKACKKTLWLTGLQVCTVVSPLLYLNSARVIAVKLFTLTQGVSPDSGHPSLGGTTHIKCCPIQSPGLAGQDGRRRRVILHREGRGVPDVPEGRHLVCTPEGALPAASRGIRGCACCDGHVHSELFHMLQKLTQGLFTGLVSTTR